MCKETLTRKKGSLSLCAVVLFSLFLLGEQGWAETGAKNNQQPNGSPRLSKQYSRTSTVSNIFFYNSNYGILGHDVANNKAGGAWPRGTGQFYIYGGGVWFGTIKSGKKIVSIGYNPNSGASQFAPGEIGDPKAADDSLNDPAHGGKGWKEYEDNGANYVLYFSTDYDQKGVDTKGVYPDWPLRDSVNGRNGQPTYIHDVSQRKNYPPFVKSGEDMFAVYKDTETKRDPEYTGVSGKSVPIGIEVHQTTYSWGLPFAKNYIFLIYEVMNKSGGPLDNCYLAPAYDFDIGPAAADDRVKYYEADTTLNLGYTYDSDGSESGWATAPGVIAFDFLESPVNPKTGKQLGMVTWKNWVIANDPTDDPSRYDFMSSGEKDPDTAPGDKRVLCATGPFSMKAGDTARVVVAIILADDVPTLLITDNLAQSIYDHNYLTPQPPFTPNLAGTPLDHGVLLMWDSTSEKSKDALVPDSLGRPFVGYRLYRSTNSTGPWQRLKEWSIDAGVLPHSFTDVGDDDGDGLITATEQLRNNIPYYYYLSAFDEGSPKTHIDSLETPPRKDVNLVQIVPVPPAVGYTNASFGQSTTSGDLGGVKPPTFLISNQDNFNKIFGGHQFQLTASTNNDGTTLTIPITIKDLISGISEKYEVTTGLSFKPDSSTRANAGAKRGTFKQDNIFKYGVVDLRLDWEFQQLADTFHLASATISKKTNPLTNVPIVINDTSNFATIVNFAKNVGETDYELEFLPGGVDTLNVPQKRIYKYLGIKVTNVATGRVLAEGPRYDSIATVLRDTIGLEQWQMNIYAFKPGTSFNQQLRGGRNRYYLTSVVDATTTWQFANVLYLAGAQIVFDPHKAGKGIGNYGWVAPPDTATADFQAGDKVLVSFKGGVKGVFPLGASASVQISSTQKVSVTAADLDRIKIVPNPYLVGNEAQKTTDEPKLFFNHLPEKCTISIYNVAGDLITIIKHEVGSSETWDLLSSGHQRVASQLLIALIEAEGKSVMKKFAVISGGFRVVN